jgi:hypothetical protein
MRSEAKTTANKAKMLAYWDAVRRGEAVPPRRKRLTPAVSELSSRYIWWEQPAQSLRYPLRLVAKVMDLGTPDDCETLEREFGRKAMVRALREASPGWFRERSWYYWHYKLGLTSPAEEPPAQPFRRFD